jgi:hypothetical protein
VIRVTRMCGGGVPVLRRRYWWRYRGYRVDRSVFRPRRVPGHGVVLDWLGVGVFWGPR